METECESQKRLKEELSAHGSISEYEKVTYREVLAVPRI
jgi:hypothetical protein